jgi:hypothetical protein
VGWGGGQIPEDRERWLAFVHKIKNLRIPYNAGSLSNSYDFFKKDLNRGFDTVIIIHGRTDNKIQNTLRITCFLARI